MKKRYEVKLRGRLGPGPKDDKSIRILNRILEWTNAGLVYEADQRHCEIIIQELGLMKGKETLSAPGVKCKIDEDDDQQLDEVQSTRYRALVARANFMACDRLDIQFAIKELARDMAKPRRSSWCALERLGKYLKRRPRCVINYHYQPANSMIHVSTDADWAGERVSRKIHKRRSIAIWLTSHQVMLLHSECNRAIIWGKQVLCHCQGLLASNGPEGAVEGTGSRVTHQAADRCYDW